MNPHPHRFARGHTQSHLRELLAERRLAPRFSLGQCFLTDLNLLDIFVAAAELTTDDFVLEVGTGTGSLTLQLAERARSVLSVEIDTGLFELAEDTVHRLQNVKLVHADILERKNALNPSVMRAVAEMAPSDGLLRRKLVANLPYVVATPVISLLLLDDRPWERFVVTIQKELADRLMAVPSTKDYGSLSVLTQALAEVELLRELPPSAFWPRPNVVSAFVKITPRPHKRAAIRNLLTFSRFARGIMMHRRKVIRVALGALLPEVPKSDIAGFLAAERLDPTVRAESLPVSEFVRLANALPAGWCEKRDSASP